MTRSIWIGIVVVLLGAGWWYLNQSNVPAVSETTQLSTTESVMQPVATNPTSQSKQTVPTPNTATRVSVAGYYAINDNPEDGFILVSQSGNMIVLKGVRIENRTTGPYYAHLNATTTIDDSGIAKVDLTENHKYPCEMTLTFSTSSPESSSVVVDHPPIGGFCGFGQNMSLFGRYYKQPSVPANLPRTQGA